MIPTKQIVDDNFGSYVNISPSTNELNDTLLAIDAGLSGSTNYWSRTGTAVSPATVGDVVRFSSGTAALPGLNSVSETTTGLFWSTGLGITVSGVRRLFVDASLMYLRLPAASDDWVFNPISATVMSMYIGVGGGTTLNLGLSSSSGTCVFGSVPRSGTDLAGRITQIRTGANTGAGAPSILEMQVTQAGASSSTVQTHSTIFYFDPVTWTSKMPIAAGSGSDWVFNPISATVVSMYVGVGGGTTLNLGLSSSSGTCVFGSVPRSGTDLAGRITQIRTGANTGAGTPAILELQVTQAGASGTTVQTHDTILYFDPVTWSMRMPISAGSASNWVFDPVSTSVMNMYIGPGGSQSLLLGLSTTSGTITYGSAATTGTNIAGRDIEYQSGAGTGSSSTGSNILFQTSNAGASGTTVQSFTTKMTLTKLGNLNLSYVGTEALPTMTIGGDTDTGWYASAANQIAMSLAGSRTLKISRTGANDLYDFGIPGTGAIVPSDVFLRNIGWTAASSASNVVGTDLIAQVGNGTGNAAAGYFSVQGFVSVASGTTAQTTLQYLMQVHSTGTVNDVQLYLGTGASLGTKPASLVGVAIGFRDVTTEPTAGVASYAFLYYQATGDVFKYITPGGTVKTITAV